MPGSAFLLQKEQIPSNYEFEIPKSSNAKKDITLERWNSYYEYISFCMGKHSGLISYLHCRHINPAIDLLFYVIIGVPLGYLQLTLGQYTNLGVILIRYIQPLAQGISHVCLLATYFLAVINVSEIKGYAIYIMLATDPSKTVWNLCPPVYKNICWSYFEQNCTVQAPCMNKSIKLPTYLFWNFTFLGGVLPEEEAYFTRPDAELIWMTLIAWIPIFCIIILQFSIVKKCVQIVVTAAMLMKISFLFKIGSVIGYINFMQLLLYIEPQAWIHQKNWTHSIDRLLSSTMIGDFAYMMFGSCTTYSTHTDSMAFIGILTQYLVLWLEMAVVNGAEFILAKYAKIPLKQGKLFRERRAPDSLTIVPSAFDLTNPSGLWTIAYLFHLILIHIAWASINFTFILVSIYQRFPATKSYSKYLCTLLSVVGFGIEIFLYTKQVFIIRVELILIMLKVCQYFNIWFFCIMVIYLYGLRRLGDDIQFMTGKQLSSFWKITWLAAPVILCFGFSYNYILDTSHPLFRIRIPTTVLVLSPIAFFVVIVICKRIYRRNILGIFAVHEKWGPMDPALHQCRKEFNPRRQTIYKRYDQKCQHLCLLHQETYERVIAAETAYENRRRETEILIGEQIR